MCLLSLAMCPIGNRMWGDDITPRFVGFLWLTIGMWAGRPLWSLPLVAAAIWIWRAPSTRPWLKLVSEPSYEAALWRSCYILPLGALMSYLAGSILPAASAAAAMIAVPLCYRFIKNFVGVEMTAGLCVSIIGLAT